MSLTVTITYTPANDIFNAPAQVEGVVTPTPYAAIPKTAPSDAYIFAPEGSTAPVYNKENLVITGSAGTEDPAAVTATAVYLTSGQRRWPRGTTNSIKNIIEAYCTPQVPVYRAWQTFKLAITGGSLVITTDSQAEADFYRDAGKALTNYGISVTVA